MHYLTSNNMNPSDNREVVNSINSFDTSVKIGVVGIGNNVGTTEIAASLSVWISERYFFAFGDPKVSFIEMAFFESSNMQFFKRYGMGRFLDRYSFQDVLTSLLISEKDELSPNLSPKSEVILPEMQKSNSWSGVNWIVPGENLPYLFGAALSVSTFSISGKKLSSAYDTLKSMISTPVAVFDLGRGLGKEYLLAEMDLVIGIAGPNNSILHNRVNDIRSIETYRKQGGNMMWTVNASSDGIDKKYIRKMLAGGQIIYIPKFEDRRVLQCDSKMRFLFEDDFIKSELWKSFDRISGFFERAI